MAITKARLVGALVKSLPSHTGATAFIKYVESGSYVSLGKDMELTRYRQRVLVSPVTMASILNLNSVLLESPTSLTHAYAQETMAVICQGTGNRNARILLHHKLQ